MSHFKDYVLGGTTVFSSAGESDLIRDEAFDRMLNNSRGLTADQFQLIDAVASGNVSLDGDEIKADVIELDSDGFYMVQAPAQHIRRFILVYAVFPGRNKMRRIFIRSATADKIDDLYAISRPGALIRNITTRLGNEALVSVPRPIRGKGPGVSQKSFKVPTATEKANKPQKSKQPSPRNAEGKRKDQEPGKPVQTVTASSRDPQAPTLGDSFPELSKLRTE